MSATSQNKPLIGTTPEQIAYDKNCNVVQLSDTRGTSSTTTRNYAVHGNQVIQLSVNGNNLGYPTYDERGNMTQNVEAGLQMSYNLCNLPKQITAEDGTLVNYTYFADGTKFKAVDATGNGFVYTGSLRWSVEDGVLTPESIAITGGRAAYSSNGWAANYYITDHLGSVRAVTDAEGEVLDTFDYMPYGSEISSTSSTTTDYRFTGKELQSKVNNSIYDSFARFQNTYGRFMSIDPKAENFYHISPYTYCAGDPVNLVDPDGYIPIIPILWAAYEIGSAIYDVYTAYDTLTDKDASTYDKVTACGGALLSAVAPGGGYTLFSKADDVARVVKTTDKVVDSKRAVANSKTLQEHAKIGQEAHRQIEKELKETAGAKIEQRVKIGDNYVRKDAVLPDDTYVIIKPDTPTGHQAAKKREQLMHDNGYKTQTLFYDPNDPKYLPGSSTYIGPKKK